MENKLELILSNGQQNLSQPIIISWTNPLANHEQMIDMSHIKQENELNIITQIIQNRPTTSAAKMCPETNGELDKILPKCNENSDKTRLIEDYFYMSTRPEDLVGECDDNSTANQVTKMYIKTEEDLQIITEIEPNSESSTKNYKESSRKSYQNSTTNTTNHLTISRNTNSDFFKSNDYSIFEIEPYREIVEKEDEPVIKIYNINENRRVPQAKEKSSNISFVLPPNLKVKVIQDSAQSTDLIVQGSESQNEQESDDDENKLVIKEEDEKPKEVAEHFQIKKIPKKTNLLEAATMIPLIRGMSSTSTDGSVPRKYKFQCEICENSFKRKIDLLNHIKSHSDATFHCHRCGMWFKSMGYFFKHKCIICDICGETFVLKKFLKNHQRNVHNVQFDMYTCDICGKSLNYRYSIQYHIQREHMAFFKDQYECDICGRTAKVKEHLRLHMKIHEEVIECELCRKQIKQANLQVHMKSVHVSSRDFKCLRCDQSFKTKECLKSHGRTHNKSFECSECGKKFAQNSVLKEHLKWHKDPNSFKCQICNKTFSQKSCLKTHMRMHDNGLIIEKLKCTMCTYSTDIVDNLRKHELRHKRQEKNKELKKNWLPCSKCGLKVKNKIRLATHYWKKHSEVMPDGLRLAQN